MSSRTLFAGRRDTIRIGAIFPQTEMGTNPQDIATYAKTAESMGLKHLLAFDHVVGGSLKDHPHLGTRYNSESVFHEVFVLFGYLAGLTSEIELTTGVVILPQRQTVLVAKQAAEIDVLSNGRLRMGVGIGWNDIEYESLNENFRNRASRMEEQITLLRQLWGENVIDFRGKHHRVSHAGINPLPGQRSIPLWIGGSSEPAVRRAARMTDGFISTTQPGPELDALLGWMLDELARNDRPSSEFGLDGRILLTRGTEDDWKREFGYWQETGASHASLHTMNGDLDDVHAHLDLLERGLKAIDSLQ